MLGYSFKITASVICYNWHVYCPIHCVSEYRTNIGGSFTSFDRSLGEVEEVIVVDLAESAPGFHQHHQQQASHKSKHTSCLVVSFLLRAMIWSDSAIESCMVCKVPNAKDRLIQQKDFGGGLQGSVWSFQN